MPTHVKVASEYKRILNGWVMVAGTWVLLDSYYIKAANRWKKAHSATRIFISNTVITTNRLNFNLRTYLISLGWDGYSPVQVTLTIAAGVTLSASSAAFYGFTTGSAYPDGSTFNIINNGNIRGAGGKGGKGGYYNLIGGFASPVDAEDGQVGGPAFHTAVPITLTNNGVIRAGAGGGGGGFGFLSGGLGGASIGGGSGGGGAGNVGGLGGERSGPVNGPNNSQGFAGGGGNDTSGGGGGLGAVFTYFDDNDLVNYQTNGPAGGAAGSNAGAGNRGQSRDEWPDGSYFNSVVYPHTTLHGLGGAGGAATINESLITFITEGTITGVRQP